MAERVTVDLGEVPYGFDPESMVGSPVGDGFGGSGGTIVSAWIKDEPAAPGVPGRLQAVIEVPDALARLLFKQEADSISIAGKRPDEPVKVDSLEELQRRFGSSGAFELPGARMPGVYDGDPAFTVHKFGGIHSIARVYRGGFKTRYRVRWARVLWEMAKPRNVLDMLRCSLESLTEAQGLEDRMATCPHLPAWREELRDGLTICGPCGKVLA